MPWRSRQPTATYRDAESASSARSEAPQIEVELRERLRSLPGSLSAEIVGAATYEEALSHYAWAICSCSRHGSSRVKPLVLLEAVASHLPIVSSHQHGIADTARDGSEAILVAPGDPRALATAISTLLGDPEKAAELGERARRRYESEYSPDRFRARLRKLLADV